MANANALGRRPLRKQESAAASPTPRLLTPEQAAEILAVRPVTVRSWIADGRLPRVKLGRCVRVPADAVARFIEANTTPAVT